MTVSNQLMKGLLSTLAIILFCLPITAQLGASTPTASPVPTPLSSPVASPGPASSPEARQPAPGKAASGRVMIPPEKAQPARIPRFEKPPIIDGKLDAAVWHTAVV